MESESKIEEAVMEILQNADWETATEHSVRSTAADRLRLDLSDLNHKLLVRRILESYLLSSPFDDNNNNNNNKVQEEEETKEDVVEQQHHPIPHCLDPKVGATQDEDRIICKLSNKRRVAIQNFRDNTQVSIRDYYRKDGKEFPSGKGISLTAEQWSTFRSSVSAIEEAIVKMESRMRSRGVGKQIEADICNSATAFSSRGHISTERKQTEETMPDFITASASQSDVLMEREQIETIIRNPVTAFAPRENVRLALVPIETTRLNGKNYYCWMHQMMFSLEQLRLSYVLTEPCPGIPPRSEANFEAIIQAKINARKWVDDDYICRRNILSALSDHLFDRYSKKTYNGAKELWEELKLVYNEDFGTKISQVNKYIQFQMVDGISVLDQVRELQDIADSIIASEIPINENFHVSAIIAKLPPSWKEYQLKLMQEEVLPLEELMDHLRAEEGKRNL